jgi:para-aminobenzoate synthetase component 1
MSSTGIAEKPSLLVEELLPALQPHEAAEQLLPLPHLIFFDSALEHSSLGRYSFVAADPFTRITSRGKKVSVSGEPQARESADPFTLLARCIERYRRPARPELPPFQGGAAGLFGYDLCHHIENLPRPRLDEFQVPDLAVGLYDWVIAFDNEQDRAWLISTGLPEEGRRARRRARARAVEVKARLSAPSPSIERRRSMLVQIRSQASVPGSKRLTSNFSRDQYLRAVRRAIEYIKAGDCFQVNLAQRLLAPQEEHPWQLYRRLRERNPATFGGYFDMGDFVIASASPERFLRLNNHDIETRPIKGTRPRGKTPGEDERNLRELLGSAKDRAENIMIVDLLRNDLGRVCRYGSVRVVGLCRPESYQHVHHLVSEVRGELRKGLGPTNLLRAVFPGGSVTGAPKIRAMEIIAELEPTARGPYCGSLAYIGFDGSMDTSILIRTFTVGRGWVQFPVGGGIVADSVPEKEYEETWHKAEGLIRALQ